MTTDVIDVLDVQIFYSRDGSEFVFLKVSSSENYML